MFEVWVYERVVHTESASVFAQYFHISVSEEAVLSESSPLNTGDINASRSDVVLVYEYQMFSGLFSSFQSLVAEPDIGKVYLVEIHVGREIEGESWTEVSGAWWMAFDPFTYGEVDEVEEGGLPYAEVASIAACQSTASSFFYDYTAKRLYVHTLNNNSPSTKDGEGIYSYCLIARFWKCFTNRQPEGNRIIFRPMKVPDAQGVSEQLENEVYYLPYLSQDSLPTITQGVGDYYVGDLTIQFGELSFNNDGWWYAAFEAMLWHNVEVRVKVGEEDAEYGNFQTLFIGVTRNPKVSDEKATIEVTDKRVNDLRDIPTLIFDQTTEEYQYTEESSYGMPIPIPFGYCRNIIPVQSDQSIFKYKISAYPIEEVVKVYKGGVEIPSSGYSVDLNAATITLNEDPANLYVSCDVKGVKCSVNGNYSDLFGDGVYFILHTMNEIPDGQIDLVALSQLNAMRTFKMGYYLNSTVPTLDLIRLFQQSAVFQCIPRLDGIWTFKYYTSDITNATRVYKEDLEKLGIIYSTDGTFHTVVVNYNRDCGTGEYKKVTAFDDKVKYRYKEKGVLTVETALYDPTEAQTLADFFLGMVKSPPKKVDGTMGMDGFGMMPTEKVIITKTIKDSEGNDIAVMTDAVYRVLEFQKNLIPSNTGFAGLDDSQSYGAYHADLGYQDSHEAVYTDVTAQEHADSDHGDVIHQDVDHGDAYTDTYGDSHTDLGSVTSLHHADYNMHPDYYDWTDYTWPSHSDFAGPPEPPIISWNDTPDLVGIWYKWTDDSGHSDIATHSDVEHANVLHSDVGHLDSPHVDSFHGDSYRDVHTDMTHADAQF